MSEETVRVGHYKVVNFPTTATMIGFGVFSLTAAIVFLLFTKEVPHENVAPLNIVIGIILGCLGTVVAFYFGDSKKSSLQQDTINTLAQKPVEAVSVAADKQIKAAEKQNEAADTQLAAAAADASTKKD